MCNLFTHTHTHTYKEGPVSAFHSEYCLFCFKTLSNWLKLTSQGLNTHMEKSVYITSSSVIYSSACLVLMAMPLLFSLGPLKVPVKWAYSTHIPHLFLCPVHNHWVCLEKEFFMQINRKQINRKLLGATAQIAWNGHVWLVEKTWNTGRRIILELWSTFIPKLFVRLRYHCIGKKYCINVAKTSLVQRLIAFPCHIFAAYICVISLFASLVFKVEQLKLRWLK